MQKCTSVLGGLVLAFSLVGLTGCNNATGTPSGSASVSPSRIEEGKQFIATLEKLPPGERQAYAAKNQAIVQSLTTTGDPQLMTRFTQIMREPPKR